MQPFIELTKTDPGKLKLGWGDPKSQVRKAVKDHLTFPSELLEDAVKDVLRILANGRIEVEIFKNAYERFEARVEIDKKGTGDQEVYTPDHAEPDAEEQPGKESESEESRSPIPVSYTHLTLPTILLV